LTGEGQGGGGDKALPDHPLPGLPPSRGKEKTRAWVAAGAPTSHGKEQTRAGFIAIEIGIAIEIEIPWNRQTRKATRMASLQAMRKME